MKTLNKFAIAIAVAGAFVLNIAAQNNDASRITLAAYVAEQTDGLPDEASSMLSNKLNQIITNNGMGGSSFNERFIVTANVLTQSKDLTATAPPMTALNLNVTFYIGDGIDGTKFATKSVLVKGVGANETKAYIESIKMIKPSDPAFASFIEEGKAKIINYYNTRCDFIIKEANSLAAQNNFEEAIYKLTAIPNVCKECYDKAIAAIAPMYQKKIDRDCKLKLAQATNLWNANQDVNTANQVGEIISTVEPSSVCFKDVQALSEKIKTRVLDIDKREWNYKLKTQEQAGELIKAYRDVGVAYGNGQPKSVTYNVRGWW